MYLDKSYNLNNIRGVPKVTGIVRPIVRQGDRYCYASCASVHSCVVTVSASVRRKKIF